MMPITEFYVGQQFEDVYPRDGLIYVVQEINLEEKMVKVQAYTFSGKTIGAPFWKESSCDLFSVSNLFGISKMRV